MEPRFYLGRSGSGKTTTLLNEVEQKLSDEAVDGPPILYLVPEQMTFQVEYQLTIRTGGLSRAHVMSFSRLALRVLQETGGSTREHLQRAGIHMLLRKIVEEVKQDFRVFRKAADTDGFIQEMEKMVTELRRQAITPELITEKLEHWEQVKQTGSLQDKLHDIALVYERFEETFHGTYMNTEEALKQLIHQLPDSEWLQGASVYIDGFYDFSPQELLVVESLFTKADELTVALPLDHVPSQEISPNELSRFYLPAKTYTKITSLAQKHGYSWKVFTRFATKRFREKRLAQLEQAGQTSDTGSNALHIYEAVNRRAEVEGVARKIIELVRDHGYHYRDIAILIRDGRPYEEWLKRVFSRLDIPMFLDEKRSMMHHPVVELIRSTLEIIEKNWPFEAVFRALKTDLLFPVHSNWDTWRERVDELENYALAHGIYGNKWKETQRWPYRRHRNVLEAREQTDMEKKIEDRINDTRHALITPLLNLEERIKSARSVRDRCEALYLFFEDLQLPEKIEDIRHQAVADGALEIAAEHDQVWENVMDLLDQFVDAAGNDKLSLFYFNRMMDAGLESMQFALVPPAIDQVTVADMERSRLPDVHVTFIIGANEGILPAKPEEEGLIRDRERAQLEDTGISIGPSANERLWDEPFYLYMAEASPSDLLIYTYALADEDGKTLLPSPVIGRLQEQFPDIEISLMQAEALSETEKKQLSFINHPEQAMEELAMQLQQWQSGEDIPTVWWDVYHWFIEKPEWHDRLRTALGSLFYRNRAAPLEKETTSSLYGDEIQTSVSRMELFQQCAFRHFSTYGLGLKERDVYKLEAPDIGELFHAALKDVAEVVRENELAWSDLSDDDCRQIARDTVGNILPHIQRNILFSSNRHAYLSKKLEDVIVHTTKTMRTQARASSFEPIGLEVTFGEQTGDIPTYSFRLNNGIHMSLRGRIDRVDRADDNFLRIIDYKSSAQKLRFSDVYHGLSLQMPVYLDVILNSAEEWLGQDANIGGMFYFHVHNPVIEADEGMSNEQIAEEWFKKFKMQGWLPEDKRIAALMDQTIENGGRSAIIPAYIKKDGEFSKSSSSVLQKEDFASLRSYLHTKLKDIGETMTGGAVEVDPYRTDKNEIACTYCPFASVCQFDPTLPSNDYRFLPTLTPEETIERMKREGEQS
ncbi:helicase-exonuclease AddAB subunit AddB [Natribacillus halophilus]|uniref:ATP-dependent helicase/deoxyribonuclease subunit B n=1 Tax=Natribacillus halophilus TaxID=549003 RepID=A0A1G8J745_9BACI|nr:helicase-exonuclease AddAB subunit AddB [Natribacillus halophilus]SDI27006.1 DNA helicase/exodeoxyribonuclease V, subunit B [Natribacillus halophilus]